MRPRAIPETEGTVRTDLSRQNNVFIYLFILFFIYGNAEKRNQIR